MIATILKSESCPPSLVAKSKCDGNCYYKFVSPKMTCVDCLNKYIEWEIIDE